MKKLISYVIILIAIVSCMTNCDDNSGSNNNSFLIPSIAPPTGLTTTHNSGDIELSWTASASADGYNVYRSSDYGLTYAKINAVPVTGITYTDTPPADGMYYYRLRAVAGSESSPSNVAKNAIGTRLNSSYHNGCDLSTPGVYVAEGTVTIDCPNPTDGLVVRNGASLFVLDGAIIAIEYDHKITIAGLLRVESSTTDPATFTSFRYGGLTDNQGFVIEFSNSSLDYSETTGSGCIIQNTELRNLRGTIDSIRILDSSPKFSNMKISANSTIGTGYLYCFPGSGLIMEHCSLNNMVLILFGAVSDALKIERNIFTSGYYALQAGGADPGLNSGQIRYNSFDCSGTEGSLYIFGIAGSGTIPLQSNFWHGGTGTPPVIDNSTSLTVDITPKLSSAPSDAGTDW